MKIKTEVFKDAVVKAVNGASFNKMIPITGFITIEQTKNELILRTTDGMNKVMVVVNEKSKETLLTTVKADVLGPLVGKTTSEFIELLIVENYLQIKGNGIYKLDIPLDEEGALVQIKSDESKINPIDEIELNAKEFKDILKTHKASVAETMEVPCLVGYYFNEKVITTNRFLVTITNKNLFNQPILLSSSLIELLYSFEDDKKIRVAIVDNKIYFANDELFVSGYLMDEIADYPVESVEKILANEFTYSVKISKKTLLQAIDRLTLFVDPFDKNGIYLDFTKDNVGLSNKKSSGNEVLEYSEVMKKDIKFRCFSDIEFLISQLNAYPNDIVEIDFGSKFLVQFKSENIIQMLALLTLEEDDS
jgi:DNA polymerase III sliding clamp (beta) subunit (PCNA family)